MNAEFLILDRYTMRAVTGTTRAEAIRQVAEVTKTVSETGGVSFGVKFKGYHPLTPLSYSPEFTQEEAHADAARSIWGKLEAGQLPRYSPFVREVWS